MKIDAFINKLKKLEGYEVFEFWESDYIGSCPCFRGEKIIDGEQIGVWGRCWRVSDNAQDLYVYGNHPKEILKQVAQKTKRALDETEWYSPYTIIYENPNEES